MAYATNVPTVRLAFSDGFKFYGDATVVTPSATVNLPVDEISHAEHGETLADGQVLPAQSLEDFAVPDPRAKGWTAGRSHVSKWSYDVAVSITAAGRPSLLWTATINPRRANETITPGMGTLTGATSSGGGGGTITVTEDPNVPGTALIGA